MLAICSIEIWPEGGLVRDIFAAAPRKGHGPSRAGTKSRWNKSPSKGYQVGPGTVQHMVIVRAFLVSKDDAPRSATIITSEPTLCLVVKRHNYQELVGHPAGAQ